MSSKHNLQLWMHSENIHKALLNFSYRCKKLNDGNTSDSFFDKLFVATEKIDGSNLAIQIDVDTQSIIRLIGRNSVLYEANDCQEATDVTKLPKYGNAGSLGSLPIKMLEFALIMAEMLKSKNIIIYGESFRCAGQKFASWHPFGCKIYKDSSTLSGKDSSTLSGNDTSDYWQTLMMNSQMHQMFMSASNLMNKKLVIPSNHAELCDTLTTAKEHLIFPPPIMYSGTLTTIIDNLYDMIRYAKTVDFEGCFVVSEDNLHGFKWKTGMHDEQKGISKVTDFCFVKESSIASYQKLVDIFMSKSEVVSAKMSKQTTADDSKKAVDLLTESYANECNQAMIRTLSKYPSCANIEKGKRIAFCVQIAKETIDEIKQLYTESQMECPYQEVHFSSTIGKVKQHVMSIPYVAVDI